MHSHRNPEGGTMHPILATSKISEGPDFSRAVRAARKARLRSAASQSET